MSAKSVLVLPIMPDFAESISQDMLQDTPGKLSNLKGNGFFGPVDPVVLVTESHLSLPQLYYMVI